MISGFAVFWMEARDDDGGRSRSVWGRAAAKKGQQLLGRMVLLRTVSIKRLGGDEADEKAFGRFLRNKRVSEAALITAAKSHLLAQVAGRRVLTFRTPAKSTSRGIRAARPRSAEAATVPTRPFSCIQCWRFTRTATSSWGWPTCSSGNGMVQPRKRRPARRMRKIRRWLAGAEAAASLRAAGSTAVTLVADREGDLYPAFARRPGAVELLVRAQTERGLAGGGIFSHISMVFRSRIASFSICQPSPDVARGAPQWSSLRPGQFEPASKQRRSESAGNLALYALDVREIEAPAGVEPVHWRLLSSAPIDTVATAHQAIADYRRRWHIEQLFRTLKSQGLDLEDSQIKTPHVLHKIAVVACAPPLCACSLFMRAAAPISGRPSRLRD